MRLNIILGHPKGYLCYKFMLKNESRVSFKFVNYRKDNDIVLLAFPHIVVIGHSTSTAKSKIK